MCVGVFVRVRACMYIPVRACVFVFALLYLILCSIFFSVLLKDQLLSLGLFVPVTRMSLAYRHQSIKLPAKMNKKSE